VAYPARIAGLYYKSDMLD